MVMNMAEDDPRRMDEIRKYAAIYGRFDCKRKPEKPLTLHEVSSATAYVAACVCHAALLVVLALPRALSCRPVHTGTLELSLSIKRAVSGSTGQSGGVAPRILTFGNARIFHSALVRINEELLETKVEAPV
jgi:hypothetical protein